MHGRGHQDDRSSAAHHRQHLLHQEQRPLGHQVERAVVVLLRDVAQRHLLGDAGIGHDHVHLALRASDGVRNAVEIRKAGCVGLDRGDVAADELHRLVERFPATAEDERVRAFLHEPLGDGKPDPAVAAADHCDLAFQSRHDTSLGLRSRLVRRTSTRSVRISRSVRNYAQGWCVFRPVGLWLFTQGQARDQARADVHRVHIPPPCRLRATSRATVQLSRLTRCARYRGDRASGMVGPVAIKGLPADGKTNADTLSRATPASAISTGSASSPKATGCKPS
ncbi:hypothetical protein ACVWW4_000906 [Bradyrhizobium sp. LB7.1]